MNKIKSFVANLPLYPALAIRYLSDKLFVLSFRMHITFGTEAGNKLKELDAAMKKLKETLEQQVASQGSQGSKVATIKIAANERYSKLANIIKGTNDGSGNGTN